MIHHLSTEERRFTALSELFRVLRVGGQLLVYVWSLEEGGQIKGQKAASAEALVPWVLPPRFRTTAAKADDYANQTHMRYYHLFKQGELEAMAKKLPRTAITSSGFDHENWWLLLTKTLIATDC